MSEPDFERIRSIALDVRRARGPIRQSMIESRCGDDAALRREVESLVIAMNAGVGTSPGDRLLQAIDEPGGLLDQSKLDEAMADAATRSAAGAMPGVADPCDPSDPSATTSEVLPRSAGDFELLEVIGHGASAIVYRAQQSEPNRIVALKLLDPPRSSQAMRRFRQEADALARLDHPGIARIHAAGVLRDRGRDHPYLAMELVPGPPLERAAFVADDPTAIPSIVAAVADVADAVHHAHLRGVIHRDLKAANIRLAGDGRPRVLDFGVARLQAANDDHEPLTEAGHFLGTVRSMSPEQVSGDPRDVDARTDIYAIGLLLHELLTGRMPYELDGLSLAGAALVIRDAAPAPLDARGRGMPVELDAIVETALSKRPDDRYASAAALADDLRAVLDHRPVSVRPSGRARRARLFVRRHRTATIAAAAIGACLLVATGVSLNFAADASQAAAASRHDEAVSQRTRDHLEQLLTTLDSHAGAARATPDDAASRMLASFIADLDASDEWPEVSAGVRSAVGRVLLSRRQLQEAAVQLQRAADVQRAYNPRDLHLAVTLAALGSALAPAGATEQAEAAFRESINIRSHHVAAGTWKPIAGVSLPRTPYISDARHELAELLLRDGRHAEAAPLAKQLLQESVAAGDAQSNPIRLNARLRHAATIAAASGDLAGAEAHLDRAAELVTRLPADQPVRLAADLERGRHRLAAGDVAGAADASAAAFEHAAQHLPPGSFDWMVALNVHRRHLRAADRPAEGRALLIRARGLVLGHHGPEHRLIHEFDRILDREAPAAASGTS
ncbi:MAG: protein kinase [Phycisphaerales bacterium]